MIENSEAYTLLPTFFEEMHCETTYSKAQLRADIFHFASMCKHWFPF